MNKRLVEPRRALMVRDMPVMENATPVPPPPPTVPVELPVPSGPAAEATVTPVLRDTWGFDALPGEAPPPQTNPASRAKAKVAVQPRSIRARRKTLAKPVNPQPAGPTPVERLDLPQDCLPVHATRSQDVAVEKVAASPREKRDRGERWTNTPAMSAHSLAKAGLAGAVILILGLAGVLALNVGRRNTGQAAPDFVDYQMEPPAPPLDHSFALLAEDPVALSKEASSLLEAYGQARRSEEIEPLVRHGTSAGKLRERWRPWSSPPLLDRPDGVQFIFSETMDPPFMTATGMRGDFSAFCVYFLREQGRLRIDWEATEGLCDIPIADLPAKGDLKDVLVRCEIETRAFHTLAFPEERFHSFALSSADRLHWVWGYAEKDSWIDRKLRELLNENTEILEPKKSERVTLRIASRAGRDLPNQFQITDMLHNEWLSP